jgi:predicted nucleic acid-binding protein
MVAGMMHELLVSGRFACAHMIQHRLVRMGQHRRPIPGVIIAAAGISAGMPVVNDDHDFAIVPEHTPLEHEWVVARGTCA